MKVPPWIELRQLHVVRNVAKLLARRWRLGVGFATAGEAIPPQESPFVSGPSLCPLIQRHPGGRRACAESSATALQKSGDKGVQTHVCHAGLVELAAPVRVEGAVVATLIAGGFLRAGSGTPQGMLDAALAGGQVTPDELAEAGRSHPVLAESEESFVAELLAGAADDIASYIRGRQSSSAGDDAGIRDHFASLVGSSPPMQQLYRVLDRVVQADTTVLIQGENGTGKELVARAIHEHSSRAGRPFVIQNCSAFNDNLLDSELFGHKRGAFTGATTDKRGLFEVADTGTFFLDEIGDMSPALQVKVLRVLQEGTFTPVGDTVERRVDVRIIAATNRDLKAMIERGQFREDLYYRINVINLVLPPLRERHGDIAVLAELFLKRHAGPGGPKRLSPEAMRQLEGHRWPGNVRELENEIERAVVLSTGREVIAADDLSERVQVAKAPPLRLDQLESLPLPEALQTLERRMILAALERTGWNKTRAAAELEISRRNLIRLVQKYELEGLRDTGG